MQTSDLLKINRERILTQWEKEVRAKLPAATHENKSALRDSLPEFIDDIAQALTFGINNIKLDIIRIAHKHGSERANLSEYSIEEALEEFNILRKVIFEVLESHGQLSQKERDIIFEVINFGFAKAGTEFAKTQLQREEEARKLADSRLEKIKQSELKLEKANKYLHYITDIQPTLISYVDKDLRYQFVNQAYERLFKKDRSQILGTTLKESLGENAWEEIRPYIEKALNGEDAVFAKILNYSAATRYVKVHYRPSFDEQNNVEGIYVSVLDITEQMQTLDDLNQEQTVKEKLVHSLSHDLRTPITAAKMAAQLIIRNPSSTENSQKQALRIISNIDRADKMIQDLLDASRLKAGQLMKPSIEHLDVIPVVTKSLEDLKTIYGERFSLQAPSNLEVFSWGQGVMRILENLCSNAIKYGAVEKEVIVSLKHQNNFIQISVRNFGKPIEKDIKIFHEFQRASSAEASGKKGWGIGLTIVKGIAESLGGDVQVRRYEDGTSFEVYLPTDSRDKIPTNSAQSNHH